MGREDEVFEDTFSYFMDELRSGTKAFKSYTLAEAGTLLVFAVIQVLFVRRLFNRKQSSI